METIKILFLDCDGVINCVDTFRKGGDSFFPVEPYMAFLVGKIQLDTNCKVVLSSSWRHHPDSVKFINDRIVPLIDITGNEGIDPNRPSGAANCLRGREIKAWIDKNDGNIKCDHPTNCPKFSRAMCMGHKISKYAILDDENDMLPEQQENFFKTSWQNGLTDEVAKNIINHLNS